MLKVGKEPKIHNSCTVWCCYISFSKKFVLRHVMDFGWNKNRFVAHENTYEGELPQCKDQHDLRSMRSYCSSNEHSRNIRVLLRKCENFD